MPSRRRRSDSESASESESRDRSKSRERERKKRKRKGSRHRRRESDSESDASERRHRKRKHHSSRRAKGGFSDAAGASAAPESAPPDSAPPPEPAPLVDEDAFASLTTQGRYEAAPLLSKPRAVGNDALQAELDSWQQEHASESATERAAHNEADPDADVRQKRIAAAVSVLTKGQRVTLSCNAIRNDFSGKQFLEEQRMKMTNKAAGQK